jgi:hypothetical protein
LVVDREASPAYVSGDSITCGTPCAVMVSPTRYDEAGLARNYATSAISSLVPTRRSTFVRSMSPAETPIWDSTPGVATNPGATPATRPRFRTSTLRSPSGGYPSRRALVERYEAVTGIEYEHDRFYRALAVFKLAALGEMFFRRHLEGNADDDLYPQMREAVPGLGERAKRIIDGDEPL